MSDTSGRRHNLPRNNRDEGSPPPPLRVVIAPDKLKECLTATDTAEAIALGVQRACPQAILDRVPFADGGEGTVEALARAMDGAFAHVEVRPPSPDAPPIMARFAHWRDDQGVMVAALEMASASGLALVPRDRRDIARATTLGTGDLIRHALDRGARRLIIGIGGSATNDGGAGMAQALGYRFLDERGEELPPGGLELSRLNRIDTSGRDPRLEGLEVLVACDVTNPLCGPRGASAVFGPQKGADPEMVQRLDQALSHFADVIDHEMSQDVRECSGAGAAGGLGAGLMAFVGGRLRSGVELIAEAVDLERRLSQADWVLTAEGRLDGSTADGKAVAGVARLAAAHRVPVVALVGSVGSGWERLLDLGLTAILPILTQPLELEQALDPDRARTHLSFAAEQATRILLAGKS